MEGGNWILTIALSFFQNKETPFSQRLLVPLMLYLPHHRGGSSLDLLHFIVVFTGVSTLHRVFQIQLLELIHNVN